MTAGRKAIFTAIMAAIPLLALVALPVGYYAVQMFLYPYEYCGPYGEVDAELGWRLSPDATSCMSMGNRLTGETYFTSRIATNADGFRTAAAGGPTPKGAVLAAGDSWTFGYAVDYEETFPHHLAEMSGRPVVNMGVPAYGTAQVLGLLERHAGRLAPQAVVFFTQGLWERSVCEAGARPETILKPCFRPAAGGGVETITPAPGRVARQARRGVYPGGFLTAGHTGWRYFLVSRPWALATGALDRLRETVAGGEETPRPAIFAHVLDRFLGLAEAHGFAFILLDPTGYYAEAVAALDEARRGRLSYMGPEAWRAEVAAPARRLPPDEVRVPRDGHYAGPMNRLIAAAVHRRLPAAAKEGD